MCNGVGGVAAAAVAAVVNAGGFRGCGGADVVDNTDLVYAGGRAYDGPVVYVAAGGVCGAFVQLLGNVFRKGFLIIVKA